MARWNGIVLLTQSVDKLLKNEVLKDTNTNVNVDILFWSSENTDWVSSLHCKNVPENTETKQFAEEGTQKPGITCATSNVYELLWIMNIKHPPRFFS